MNRNRLIALAIGQASLVLWCYGVLPKWSTLVVIALSMICMALPTCDPLLELRILWRNWFGPRHTPEQLREQYLQHIEQHMNAVSGINSVARGESDQHEQHARAHAEVFAGYSPPPLTSDDLARLTAEGVSWRWFAPGVVRIDRGWWAEYREAQPERAR